MCAHTLTHTGNYYQYIIVCIWRSVYTLAPYANRGVADALPVMRSNVIMLVRWTEFDCLHINVISLVHLCKRNSSI